jgi:3-isopropylmalate/(R)-2-methylmalate dehydratase small subunit
MKPLTQIRSCTAVLADENIDTDRIIPARFLTTTEREGLGRHAFHDWRFRADGSPDPAFALNHAKARGCEILVAGRNFGCGSSREHAAWALLDYGFRAVLSSEIADIFRSNSLKNGLVPVLVDEATHRTLLAQPGAEIEIDLERCSLTLPDGSVVTFPIEAFSRYCLLNGIDELGFLLSQADRIAAYEQAHA